MNYETDIVIDETALDVEWLEQPNLMMRYARVAATARMNLDLAKESLDFVRAELDKKIRTDPGIYGIEKVTETVVQNIIIAQDEYKEASRVVISAKFEADVAQGAVRAFEARKDALENLVRLHGQQYFAGPKVPRDLSWEREEKQKRLNAKIAEKTKVTRTK
jgi:hypothetical protein